MNCHFLMVALLLTLIPQNQQLPREFDQIPEPLREKATVIVSGTYGHGNYCITRRDLSSICYPKNWFRITKVYRGQVGGPSIYIDSERLPKTKEVRRKLKDGRGYLILLRPSEKSLEWIRNGDEVWNAIHGEEIIAIVESK